MAELTRLYIMLIGARIRAQMQYKLSFVLEIVGTLVSSGVDLAVILILFGQVRSLGGWMLPEVCLLYGMSSTAFALSELFMGGFDFFSGMVRTGQFDSILIRPLPDFMQMLSAEFLLRRLARFAQGAAALAYALSHVHAMVSTGDLVLLTLAIASGAMAYGSLVLVQATVCFWSVEGLEVFNILTYGGNEMLSHPLDIYGGWLRRFFTFVIPMAFINYLPAAFILGKTPANGLPPEAGWLSPLVGPIMFGVGMIAWRFGVRHYQSTGS